MQLTMGDELSLIVYHQNRHLMTWREKENLRCFMMNSSKNASVATTIVHYTQP